MVWCFDIFGFMHNAFAFKIPLFKYLLRIGIKVSEATSRASSSRCVSYFVPFKAYTKDSVDGWVRKAGCTVYGYKEDAENSSAEERQEFLKKLGSEDGIELTAGRLIAFTEGKRRGAIAGTFDLESAQNVDIFARRYFSFPEKDSFVNSDRKLLSGLKELRALLAEKKNFILYTERRTCPFCRLLSDPQSYNSLTLLLKNSPLPLYKIISEDMLRDLYKEVSVDGKSYPSVFDYLKDSDDIFVCMNNKGEGKVYSPTNLKNCNEAYYYPETKAYFCELCNYPYALDKTDTCNEIGRASCRERV